MSDEKKDDGECTIFAVHGPTCPVTEAFREITDEMVGRAGEEADATNSGPAKFATNAYRQGWDNIFGKKQEVGQA